MAVPPATASEAYLAKLCERAFLKLWSFPRLFTDEGIKRNGGQGKELCDLLVIFENDVVIFSDKHCEFPDTGDVWKDWSRWYRRAIEKSARQIWGAERWLRRFPNRVFMDTGATERVPLPLPDSTSIHVHRIVVAHGVSARCGEYWGDTSGTLLVDSSLHGSDHACPERSFLPFSVGHVNLAKGFVHVFDDEGVDLLLTRLDTVRDLLDYIAAREKLLTKRKVVAPGEEELLAFYLRNTAAEGTRSFSLPGSDYDFVSLDTGFAESYWNDPRTKAKLGAEKISYVWDELINRFATHAVNGTQYYTSHPGQPYDIEPALRIMAAESRTRRRLLAQHLLDLVLRPTPEWGRATRVVQPKKAGDPYYVLLALGVPGQKTEAEYREFRRNLLEACCIATKARYPDAGIILGIATEPGISNADSEDLLWLDARELSPEQEREGRRLADELELLVNVQRVEHRFQEYPAPRRILSQLGVSIRRVGRNEPCPCGSGRKYKKCCGDC